LQDEPEEFAEEDGEENEDTIFLVFSHPHLGHFGFLASYDKSSENLCPQEGHLYS